MADLIATSTTEVENISNLLDKKLPTYRQAYSDRTSWIMACVAELSYIRFNPLFPNQDHKKYFLKKINSLIKDNDKPSLDKLINVVGYDHNKEKEDLVDNLSLLKLELIATFDNSGTQAIIVSNGEYAILGFRGTEATSIRDIKADAKAQSVDCETGGSIHSGFKEAYNRVGLSIQKRLDEDDLNNIPLYITGHSLGGALATIAAKKLKHQSGIAACYTYGSPRVGDEIWVTKLKTPIYRVVNAADCVTMLPPGDETISVISWLVQLLPYFGRSLKTWLLSNFKGYLHGGNMRYMTNCKNQEYSNVKLLYSVSLFYRIKGLFIKKLPWSKPLADHSISTYRTKLLIIANDRNK